MRNNFFKSLLMALALLVHLPGSAEDIDVFMGVTPSTTDQPNVLIVMDNTANWNSAFVNEKSALVTLLRSLQVDKFKVGLMMFTETGGSDSGDAGAYVRAAIRQMDSTGKTRYAALVNSLDPTADKSNGGKVGRAMQEAYMYFSGGAPYAGNQKAKADYLGNNLNLSGTLASRNVYALANNALASKDATTYNRPSPADSCAKNFIIYISNGPAQDNSSDTTAAKTALANAGGSTELIPLNPSGSQDNVADEWARFMKESPLGITVYTIGIKDESDRDTNGQLPGWTELLNSMAAESGGRYFDVESGDGGNEILEALTDVFSQIQAVNSVFASVSLPVSANSQGTYLNQIFLGMFRPNVDSSPRWKGNLKQYKLAEAGTSLQLQGADGRNAINNSETGFVSECAVSFWTPTTADNEWKSAPAGNCLSVARSKISNFPDGNVVEKGGQAYKLRQSTVTRTVKTCNPGVSTCDSLTEFNIGNDAITPTDLNALTSAERDLLIKWAIGEDNKDDEDRDRIRTDNRLSLHGDVIHSRPVAVNFGTTATPNVVVYYGGNDGMLRAINGNRTTAIGIGTNAVPAGEELWAFMPPEFYPSIRRLRRNTPAIRFPSSVSGTPHAASKPYGVDGPITAYKEVLSGGQAGKVYIYAPMRRGGRVVYAFDASNSLTAPRSPSLKWKIGCPNKTNDLGCTTDLEGIGQTWSSLVPMKAAGFGSGNTPLLIMGGGYDNCEDYDETTAGGANHRCNTRARKGHYVYVINGETGAVVKTFDTGGMRGIVADITLVPDANGKAMYGYTADLGGNVYRIKFGNGLAADDNTSTWTMTRIASLGCDTTASCTANRKFMFAPSVAASNGNYIVLLGSGDREKPLDYFASATAVSNMFFMFTDKPGVSPAIWPGSTDCGSRIICLNSLLGITTSATPSKADLKTKKGWYLGMAPTEQVVTSALTLSGVVTFSTHQPPLPPASGSCSPNLGRANVYNIGFANAQSANGTNSRFQNVVTGGLGASPVGGLLVGDEPGSDKRLFCVGCSPEPFTPTDPPPGTFDDKPKGRLYWYIQK